MKQNSIHKEKCLHLHDAIVLKFIFNLLYYGCCEYLLSNLIDWIFLFGPLDWCSWTILWLLKAALWVINACLIAVTLIVLCMLHKRSHSKTPQSVVAIFIITFRIIFLSVRDPTYKDFFLKNRHWTILNILCFSTQCTTHMLILSRNPSRI